MKKSLTGIVLASTLFILGGCSNSDNTNKSSSKKSTVTQRKTNIATKSVYSLFVVKDKNKSKLSKSNINFKKLSSDTNMSKIKAAEKKVNSSNDQYATLMPHITEATGLLRKREAASKSTTRTPAKFLKKLEKLGVGGAHATAVSYSHNTVTWTGYEAWGGYTQEQLTGNMNILETITERQAVVYKLTPKIIVKTPSGKQLAHKNVGDDMMWDIDE